LRDRRTQKTAVGTEGHRSYILPRMINGAHFLLYSSNPDADRAFLKDFLKLRFVDVGHGWLIFALPPSEIAVHPAETDFVQAHAGRKLAGSILYFMCDDLSAEMKALQATNVKCSEVLEAEWGIATTIRLPSGMELGLYQPKHARAK